MEGVLVVFFLFKLKKKYQPTDLVEEKNLSAPKPPQPPAKPKTKSIPIAKTEVTNDTVRFLVEKGLFKKRWVAVKEIPVFEITGLTSSGNELAVIWKGATDTFAFKKKGESFSKLRDQIQGLIEEQRKTLENNAKAAQRKTDLIEVINASVGVVDLSFDVLLGLQVKKINWTRLETYINGLGENLTFAGQTVAPLTLDFSKVSNAVKSQVPRKASKETFNVLKSIYGYFDDLKLEEDLNETHPNFKDAKAVISAYYTLNDLLLGKIVGEKDTKKEILALETTLKNLGNETNAKVNVEELKGYIDKMDVESDTQTVVGDIRELFKEQLKNIDLPTEQAKQASTVEPPTEPAAIAPPEPKAEPVPPPEPQAPTEPSVPQPAVEPQPIVQPPPIEQPSIEQPLIEQPSIEQQVPMQEEAPLPESEAEVKPPEPPAKKNGMGQRLRKKIMGY